MNVRHCLTCKRWERNITDHAIGTCELGEVKLPFSRLRFQFEQCDCGMYVFKEHRQPHREPWARPLLEMDVTR